MKYVHITQAECDALKFLYSPPRRTFRQLQNRFVGHKVSVSSLIGGLVAKGLVTVEETECVGGFGDGVKAHFYTSNVTPRQAAQLRGMSALSDAMSGQIESTFRWLKRWMKAKRARHLMKESGIWEHRCKNISAGQS